ncbi:acyltransferase family protein [Methyloterricola oryzae]|uniref:acyltransferase family protein n=1 Tax=Methyloterricola oryzae TaxID=1495050 RepID=UPI0011AFA052|nr:acyltransferase family protein [Methyloterricola oryzae]
MKQRVRYVDIAKGMSITLVALGHSTIIDDVDVDTVNRMLGTVRMPFFFFLSGLFFNFSRGFLTTLVQKTDQLLKPYFVTLCLALTWHWWINGANVSAEIVGALYGVGRTIPPPWIPLWYLPHLWLLFLSAWSMARCTDYPNRSPFFQAGMVCLLYAAGVFLLPEFRFIKIEVRDDSLFTPGLPFSLDLVPVSAAYFLLGVGARGLVGRFRPRVSAVVLCTAVVFMAGDYAHPKLNLNLRLIEQPILTGLTSLAGIYLAVCIAYLFDRTEWVARTFSKIGEKSLFVLIFHSCLYLRSVAVLNRFDLGWAEPLCALVACILGSVLLGELIQRIPVLSKLYYPIRGKGWIGTQKKAYVAG